MREFKAAALAVTGIAVSLLFAVIAYRVITPAILEAHFDGGTLVATVVALVLAALLIAFTAYWVRLVGRWLRNDEQSRTNEEAEK